MSDTVLGLVVIVVLVVPGLLLWYLKARQVDRMTAEQQQALRKRWSSGGSGNPPATG
jgi:uncharacterized membrane protein YqiK